MLAFTGNTPYCYANSLHMCLAAAGMPREQLPEPGFLQCLTTMPFGNQVIEQPDGPLIYFDGLDPDRGLDRALDALGWTCDTWRGDDPTAALTQLRAALAGGPVLVGPLDFGGISYNPNARFGAGSDHFVVVLSVDDTAVRLHDPGGFPHATLPAAAFLAAWRADAIDYATRAFTLRARFRPVARRTRAEMIAHALPLCRANLTAPPDPGITLSGVPALERISAYLRIGAVSPKLSGHLAYFALPIAARHAADAACFLAEAGHPEAAALFDAKAQTFGAAQLPATAKHWPEVAAHLENITSIERHIIEVLE